MRISVEPEQLRTAGSGLQRSAEQLQDIAEHLNRLLTSFSQDNEAAWGAVQVKWEQARRLSEQIGKELYRLGEGLKIRSASFDESDRGFGASISKGSVSYGPSSMMYRTLHLGTDSLILPATRFSPGVISNPRSAVDAVRRERRLAEQDHEISFTSAGKEQAEGDPVLSGADSKMLPFPGLSRKRAAGRMILREAAMNPKAWIFTNPAAGL
ncbi:hypothetical protein [Paenibacillus caui]|uniref:hypothetical protein n=1 Tax=Paenibacillus caui TaxID=2873927 RepID=UPI001CAA3E0D|nr:hypothetical protein [Paenibacillus caui]